MWIRTISFSFTNKGFIILSFLFKADRFWAAINLLKCQFCFWPGLLVDMVRWGADTLIVLPANPEAIICSKCKYTKFPVGFIYIVNCF